MKKFIGIIVALPLLAGFSFAGPTERGTEAYGAGRYDEALEAYQKAAYDNPGKAEAHYNLAGAHFRKGEYDRALKEYEEAARLEPEMADVWYNMGDALYRMDQYDAALGAFQKADGLRKGDRDTVHNIGVTLARIKKEQEKKQGPQVTKGQKGQSKNDKGQGRHDQSAGNLGQGSNSQGRQARPSLSNEEIQAMLERQKKEEHALRNYFRPGKKDEASDREAQIEQMLRGMGKAAPGARPARPGA